MKLLDKLHFEFRNDWVQLVRKCNWYNAHVLELYFENDHYCGQCELAVMVVGIGFRLTLEHETEKSKENVALWAAMVEECATNRNPFVKAKALKTSGAKKKNGKRKSKQ